MEFILLELVLRGKLRVIIGAMPLVSYVRHCVMAQAVSRRPLTAEAWVRAWFASDHVGFAMNKVALGQGFFRVLRFYRRYYSTVALHTHISPGGGTVGPLIASVQTHSLIPST
jgi:hypothetical protein